MSAEKLHIKVLYGCYYRGVRYDPGVYELDWETAKGLLKTMHAIRHTPPKKAAKLKGKVVKNGS